MAGIGAVGFAGARSIRIMTTDCGRCGPFLWMERLVERLRRAIAHTVRGHMKREEAASLALALMTGERGALSRDVRESLRAAGLAHILAISGLHLGLVAGAVFWLVRAGLAAFPALALNWPVKKIAAGIALVVALAYLVLSGNSVATRRAFIMLAVALLALLMDRPAISMRNLAVAALLILLLAPHKAVSAGFQMSFMAVMGLVAVYEYFTWRRMRRDERETLAEQAGRWRLLRWPLLALGGIALTTLVASAFTALPVAWHFNRLPTWGLLGNLAALPLLTVMVMPAGLLALALMPLGLAGPPLTVMEWGLSGMLRAAQAIAGLPDPWWPVPAMSAGAAFLMAAGLTWLSLRADRLRMLGLLPLLAGLLWPFAQRPEVLVEDRARLLAVRMEPRGPLAAAPQKGRAGDFALRIWLRRDGDTGSPKQARRRPGWTCDRLACEARVGGGLRVLYLRDVFRKKRRNDEKDVDVLERMRARCERAELVVAAFPLRGLCRHGRARVVIDRFDVWRNGAYALSVGRDGRVVATHVRGSLPRRPWATPPLSRREVRTTSRSH